MSVFVMEWVMDNSRTKPTARFVLVAIARHANHDGTGARPSSATLQRLTGFSERAVRDAVNEAERIGELEVQRGAGANGCNLYRIIMTPAGDAASTESTRQEMPEAGDAPRQEMPHPPADAAVSTGQQLPPNSPLNVLEPSLGTNTDGPALFDTPPNAERKPKASKKAKPAGHWSEDPDFVAWYDGAYVKKGDPADAHKAWLRAKDKPLFPGVQELIRITKEFTAAFLASGTELRFAKAPATWLNQECWHNPLPQTRASPNGNRLVGADTRNGEIDWNDPRILEM